MAFPSPDCAPCQVFNNPIKYINVTITRDQIWHNTTVSEKLIQVNMSHKYGRTDYLVLTEKQEL